ncbi:hypothetical protein K432DRAFT_447470 [Lepidopterella palustris CBS 459.81]|uniref:Uncharacterized protein n=1 Tax=Lepidopterella palustris CBS 459.81 TaxID=1314670 RepID=A0A8E2DYW8_9PEZI|nr:hypothetical protein K432DRAFT_447470 [Lepidopterella palustris CBS 459.81]
MRPGLNVVLFSLVVTLTQAAIVVTQFRSFCACIVLKSFSNTTNTSEAERLLGNISIDASDQALCDNWTAFPSYQITIFADSYGKPTTNISDAVGIFAQDIYAFCGPQNFRTEFSFQDFTSSTAGLLLPWIAIFAQLGRQTGSRRGDVQSILISIGNPAWIFSSITLAALFCRTIRQRFDRLRTNLVSGPSGALFFYLAERCKAAQTILQSFLQAPVRLSTRPGFLSSLILSPENHWWWIAAEADLRALQRRIDAVFISQSIVAVLAWVLAIVADFWSNPGTSASPNSSEWQICMGTFWLWLFAATYGPIAIKSLYKAGAMDKIISAPGGTDNRVYSHLDDSKRAVQRNQTAIMQRPGLTPTHQHYREVYNRRQSEFEFEIQNEDSGALDDIRIPKWWGFSIEGDGEREGPVNFAPKFFTSWWTCQSIIQGFEAFHDRLKTNQVPDADYGSDNGDHENKQSEAVDFRIGGLFVSEDAANSGVLEMKMDSTVKSIVGVVPVNAGARTWDSRISPEENLRGTSKALDRYLRITVAALTAYPEWKDIGWDQWGRFFVGNMLGLLLQWGTCGPAIYVMYFSPPIGLGCDSGGLLIYGVFASLSWLLLVGSMFFSHAALLHYQRYHHKNPGHNFSKPNPGIIGRYWGRTRYHSMLCGTAVVTRIFGKSIAIVNAFWILAWSLMSYTNVMETPYCTTAYFSLHKHGWMRLWNFDLQEFINTKVQELGCLVFGSVVAYFACVLIFVLTSDERTKRYRCYSTVVLIIGFLVPIVGLTFYGTRSIQAVS